MTETLNLKGVGEMIKRITISVEEDSGSTMQHTVSTKEEAIALIDRYFKEEKL